MRCNRCGKDNPAEVHTCTPLAIRLADALDKRRVTRWVHATGETPRASGYAVDVECAQAAAELRRLHAEVEELRGALDEAVWHVKYKELKAVNEELLEALKMIANLAHCPDNTMSDKDIARAAIAKAGGGA